MTSVFLLFINLNFKFHFGFIFLSFFSKLKTKLAMKINSEQNVRTNLLIINLMDADRNKQNAIGK